MDVTKNLVIPSDVPGGTQKSHKWKIGLQGPPKRTKELARMLANLDALRPI